MAMEALCILLFLLHSLALQLTCCDARALSAVRKGPWRHEVVEGRIPGAAVTANFTNNINKTGCVGHVTKLTRELLAKAFMAIPTVDGRYKVYPDVIKIP